MWDKRWRGGGEEENIVVVCAWWWWCHTQSNKPFFAIANTEIDIQQVQTSSCVHMSKMLGLFFLLCHVYHIMFSIAPMGGGRGRLNKSIMAKDAMGGCVHCVNTNAVTIFCVGERVYIQHGHICKWAKNGLPTISPWTSGSAQTMTIKSWADEYWMADAF